MATPTTLELFCSYAHKDSELLEQFSTALAAVRRNKWIEVWTDHRISAGNEFAPEIDRHLDTASLIVLLVSADFLNSDYCYTKELARAMERHEAEQATVLPVIVRPCDWSDTPFASLKAIPKDGKAVTLWANRDEAWTDVATSIKLAIKERFERIAAVMSFFGADRPQLGETKSGPDQQKAAALREQMRAEADHQRKERWQIMQDVQSKIFAISQDVQGVHLKSADRAFAAMDGYINSAPAAKPKED